MIMHSALYTGQLRHSRSAPRAHAFNYRVCMQWLDLAELDRVGGEALGGGPHASAPAKIHHLSSSGECRTTPCGM